MAHSLYTSQTWHGELSSTKIVNFGVFSATNPGIQWQNWGMKPGNLATLKKDDNLLTNCPRFT
jgi:hypothetical protein